MSLYESALNAVPHPAVVGCVLIGVGFVASVLAAVFHSKADRARRGRTTPTNAKARKFQVAFVLVLLCGALATTAGTGLTIRAGRLDAARAAGTERERARAEAEEARKELEAKFQTILVALNAAKAEQNWRQVEQRIEAITGDLVKWADEFARRKPEKQRQLLNARLTGRQYEIQVSERVSPHFSFVLRFVEEAVAAYAKQTGDDVPVTLQPFPQNLYDSRVNDPRRRVRFPGGGVWEFLINANSPADESRLPELIVSLTNNEGRAGSLTVRRHADVDKISTFTSGVLPMPTGGELSSTFDLRDSEGMLRGIFQRLLEAQLSEQQPSTSP